MYLIVYFDTQMTTMRYIEERSGHRASGLNGELARKHEVWYNRSMDTSHTTLTVATYNLHANAVRKNPAAVLRDIELFMQEADFLCVQEAGEAGALLREACQKFHLKLFDGFDKYGQAATPILYKAEALEKKSFPLTPTTHVGEPGAGPGTMKAKWLNALKFSFYGRDIWIASIHTTPSVYIPVREELALRQTRGTAEALKGLTGFKFLGGDFNSLPDSAIRKPLLSAGFGSSQAVLKPIATFGKRFIDDVHFSNSREVRPVEHWVRRGVSDHHGYFVKYEITPTRKWHHGNQSVFEEFKHIHSSSRFDGLESLEASVRRYTSSAQLVTLTEVAEKGHQRVLRKISREAEFGLIAGDNGGADDCAIMYDKNRFELVYTEQFKSANGVKSNPPHSTIAVLRDIKDGRKFVVTVGHYASGVEGALAKNERTYRRAIQWRRSVANTKNRANQLAKEYDAKACMVVADWNVNFKRAWVRAMVKAIAPSYTNTWTRVNIEGGTYGNRLTDATLLRGRMKVLDTAKLYRDDASSDHRPYIETISWR